MGALFVTNHQCAPHLAISSAPATAPVAQTGLDHRGHDPSASPCQSRSSPARECQRVFDLLFPLCFFCACVSVVLVEGEPSTRCWVSLHFSLAHKRGFFFCMLAKTQGCIFTSVLPLTCKTMISTLMFFVLGGCVRRFVHPLTLFCVVSFVLII